jgi:Flp pilus assembly protein TadD
MKQSIRRSFFVSGVIAVTLLTLCRVEKQDDQQMTPSGEPAPITIDYPVEGSLFPPEFPAPAWLWRDADEKTVFWNISVTFSDGTAPISTRSTGERMRIGGIDQRCVSSANKPPALTPEQAAAHTWRPDAATWAAMKKHSTGRPATIVITGHHTGAPERIVSRGSVTFSTSADSVGAPVFYRDVPLMPSENEKGVIKPLAPQSIPLIAWRLRNIAETRSSLLMEGLHTCANCHSFSADGGTMGMDMDGPRNDKGLYAIVKVQRRMSIGADDQIAWSSFRGKLGSTLRVGFMSQLSPDGRYVVTMVSDPGIDQTAYERRKKPVDLEHTYYVANFTDYRFLQVFYPTHGILAWYSPQTGHLRPLPGADDTGYVHTNAVWSPDGKYLVFARAKACNAYPGKTPAARHANDSNETRIQYDLYRIPFNGGRGGKAEPVAGASHNGMSNSFPKISPDGRWIVFVQAHNGLLMRPDGQLYIVPAQGGIARRMNCNTPLMNSWHSFSPNGRWMVFSSKSRTPYTQMFLTHIDSAGNDSPPVLIENATAANRAVNIPEFVNIPPDGIDTIAAPAAEYALHTDLAIDHMKKRRYEAAIREWNDVLKRAPEEFQPHNNLGVALMETGRPDEAIGHYRQALRLNPQYTEAYNNLGEALAGRGDDKAAIREFTKAVQRDSSFTVARMNLGLTLARNGRTDEALFHLRKVAELTPGAAEVHRSIGHALAEKGRPDEALGELEQAVNLSESRDPLALFLLGRVNADLGRISDALEHERLALAIAIQLGNRELAQAISAHLDVLQQKQ